MSKMSDFNVWIEDILVSRGWDLDDPDVLYCLTKHQGYLMSMYAGGCPEREVSRAFAGFWHRSSSLDPSMVFEP